MLKHRGRVDKATRVRAASATQTQDQLRGSSSQLPVTSEETGAVKPPGRRCFTSPRKALRAFIAALALTMVAAFALTGCSQATNTSHKFTIFATTGYLADAAKNIAPNAEIFTLVGPGGDPHTYEPSSREIERMRTVDFVLWNGLHLEARMIKQLSSLGVKQLAVGDTLPEDRLLDWPESEGDEQLHDPHIWNDPDLWALAVEHIAEKAGQLDPEHAAEYSKNAESYQAEILQAKQTTQTALAKVEPEQRVLISGHDAFSYFGRSFGFEIYATDFISTEAKLSPEKLSSLADLIASRQIPVIFQDNQVNPQAITSLQEAVQARGWKVRISHLPLYADTLGIEPGVDTYLGAFTHNAETVAAELAGNENHP